MRVQRRFERATSLRQVFIGQEEFTGVQAEEDPIGNGTQEAYPLTELFQFGA